MPSYHPIDCCSYPHSILNLAGAGAGTHIATIAMSIQFQPDKKKRVLKHETLKLFFATVDFPPVGSYFKSFAKMLDVKVRTIRLASGGSESRKNDLKFQKARELTKFDETQRIYVKFRGEHDAIGPVA